LFRTTGWLERAEARRLIEDHGRAWLRAIFLSGNVFIDRVERQAMAGLDSISVMEEETAGSAMASVCLKQA